MLKAKSNRSKSKSPAKERITVDPFLLIRKGDISEIRDRILAKEISLHATRWSGFTLLHRAAEIGHSELCIFLIQQGISVDIRTSRGWFTPLHIALGNGYIETAQALIDEGADMWKKNKNNEDAFDYGSQRGFTKICEEFKAKFVGKQLKENVQRMLAQSGPGNMILPTTIKPKSITSTSTTHEEISQIDS